MSSLHPTYIIAQTPEFVNTTNSSHQTLWGWLGNYKIAQCVLNFDGVILNGRDEEDTMVGYAIG